MAQLKMNSDKAYGLPLEMHSLRSTLHYLDIQFMCPGFLSSGAASRYKYVSEYFQKENLLAKIWQLN